MTAAPDPSAEDALHAAICNAVILLNNGEEIAPRVSAILRQALFDYSPSAPAAAVGGDAGAVGAVYEYIGACYASRVGDEGGDHCEWLYAQMSVAEVAEANRLIPLINESMKGELTPAAPVGGFVVVPREPTEAMLSAAIDAAYEPGTQDGCADFGLAYAAMIAASPAAQSSAKDGVRVGVPGYGGVPVAFDDPELLQW